MLDLVEAAQEGGAARRRVLDETRQHVSGEHRIEGGQRLVDEQGLGVGDERAGEGDALTLAAGQAVDPIPESRAETDTLERGVRDACVGVRHADEQAKCLRGGACRQASGEHRDRDALTWRQRWRLGGEVRATTKPAEGRARQRPWIESVETDAAGARAFGRGERPEQRRLARAARADQRDPLAAGDVERQTRDRRVLGAAADDEVAGGQREPYSSSPASRAARSMPS